MRHLFEPVKMHHMELKNRFIRSATWEGTANPDGSITEKAYNIYEELAKGGVSLHDDYFDDMMRLCDNALIPQCKKLTDIIHAENCPVIVVGGFGSLDIIGDVLNKAKIELISLSRPLLCDPTPFR